MAAKAWGNFAITGVRLGTSTMKIEMLEVREYKVSFLGSPEMKPRSTVIEAIDQGISFVTATLNLTGNEWQLGEDVRVVVTYRGKFLRTDSNAKDEDNLGNLPRV